MVVNTSVWTCGSFKGSSYIQEQVSLPGSLAIAVSYQQLLITCCQPSDLYLLWPIQCQLLHTFNGDFMEIDSCKQPSALGSVWEQGVEIRVSQLQEMMSYYDII